MSEQRHRIKILVIDILERIYNRNTIAIISNDARYTYFEGEAQFTDPKYIKCEVDVISCDDCGELYIYLVD